MIDVIGYREGFLFLWEKGKDRNLRNSLIQRIRKKSYKLRKRKVE